MLSTNLLEWDHVFTKMKVPCIWKWKRFYWKVKVKWENRADIFQELDTSCDTENDPDFKYHFENSKRRGYGHIDVMVLIVDEVCEKCDILDVNIIERPVVNGLKYSTMRTCDV